MTDPESTVEAKSTMQPLDEKLEEQMHKQLHTKEVDIYRDTFLRYMGKSCPPHIQLNVHMYFYSFHSCRLQQRGGRSISSPVAQIYSCCLLWHGHWLCLHWYLWQGVAPSNGRRYRSPGGASGRRCVHLANVCISYNTWIDHQSVVAALFYLPTIYATNKPLSNLHTSYSITAVSKTLLKKSPSFVVKTLPTLIGLISIPLIVHPIDSLVDRLMDATYRKMVR